MHVRGSSSGGVSGHWILLLLAYASLHGCTQYETEQSTVSGDSTHLVAAFEGLLATSAADAFLVVGVSGAEDFLQLTAVPGSVQLDLSLDYGKAAGSASEFGTRLRRLGISSGGFIRLGRQRIPRLRHQRSRR
jgi:hypothetical protein